MPTLSKSSRRTHLLKRARDLARTGDHANAVSVIAALEGDMDLSEVREWLADRRFAEQLDQLCYAVRSGMVRNEIKGSDSSESRTGDEPTMQ